MMNAANNNFIVAPRMTPTQITKAVAFVLFDLVLIELINQYGVPPPIADFSSLLWRVLWAYLWLVFCVYAVILAAGAYVTGEHVVNGLKKGSSSRYYVTVMVSRPMPPMILSAISVGVILSLSWFSFRDAGIVGIIPSGLLLYTGLTSAMIYTHRLRYHASVERQTSYDRQAASINPNIQKTHVSGTKPYCHRMGESSQSDR